MINRKEAILSQLALHFIGNEQEEVKTTLSKELVDLSDEMQVSSFLKLFIDNFKEPEFFSFCPIAGSLEDNFMYQAVCACFDDDSDFLSWSHQVVKYLNSHATHHRIKSGELLIFKVSQLLFLDELVDGIGFCKIENKEPFLTFEKTGGETFTIHEQNGALLNKPDKISLILDTDRENGFTVLNIDHVNRNQDAKYWRDDFLRLIHRSDDYHNTKQYIQLTKEFIHDRMAKEFDTDKSDQAITMQRSLDYFTKQESFDQFEYATRVFQDDKVVEAFKDFKSDYENYKQLDLADAFAISEQAVKKQSRVFKSVIKLDKNFHIYVHGNSNLIQKGIDEEGRKYYVLYYQEES